MARRGSTRSDGLAWWASWPPCAGVGLGAVFSRWAIVLGMTAVRLAALVVDELRRRRGPGVRRLRPPAGA